MTDQIAPETAAQQLAIEFGITAAEEHAKILEAVRQSSKSAYTVGVHLGYMREKRLFLELPGNYHDFLEYVVNGLDLSVTTAYRYVDAAYFPAWVMERFGIDKAAELRKLVSLTAADETPEEAVALRIPLKDGGTKSFEEATAEEVRQARKLIKAGQGKVARKTNGDAERLRDAARLFEAEIESATQDLLEPNQVLARVSKGKLVLDLKGIPQDQARAIFDALSAAVSN